MRQTYTVVTMEVSQAAFMEIHAKILGAGYEHALMKVARDDSTKLGDRDAIDMTGIALTPSDDPGSAVSFAEHLHTDGARLIDGARGSQEAMNQLLAVATRLMECAEEHGFVLTIAERSLKPLAMGHTETVALVRPRRDPSDPAGYVTPHLADGDEAFKKPPPSLWPKRKPSLSCCPNISSWCDISNWCDMMSGWRDRRRSAPTTTRELLMARPIFLDPQPRTPGTAVLVALVLLLVAAQGATALATYRLTIASQQIRRDIEAAVSPCPKPPEAVQPQADPVTTPNPSKEV